MQGKVTFEIYNNVTVLSGHYNKDRVINTLSFTTTSDIIFFNKCKKRYRMNKIRKLENAWKQHNTGAPTKEVTDGWGKEADALVDWLIDKGHLQKPQPRVLTDGEIIPTGLVEYVSEKCFDGNINIVDKRIDNGEDHNLPTPISEMKPRIYQNEAIIMALNSKSGIIGVGTAGGKTIITLNLIERFGKKFIYVTKNIDLIIQTAKAIYRYYLGEDVSVDFTDSSANNQTIVNRLNKVMQKDLGIGINKSGENGTLCTTKSLSKFSSDPSYGTLLFDECQGAAAKNVTVALAQYQGRNRIGLTASVKDRSDKLDILNSSYLGPITYWKSHESLRDEGYVCGVEVIFWTFNHLFENEDLDQPHEIYNQCIVYNKARNTFIVRLLERYADEPVITFVRQIDHGKILESLLQSKGVKAKFFDAASRGDELNAWLKNPDGIIIVTGFLDTGIDCPSLSVGFNAAGGKSDIEATQKTGRVLRLHPSKKTGWVTYLDIMDINQRVLHKWANARKQKYKSLGYKITMLEEQDSKNVSLLV